MQKQVWHWRMRSDPKTLQEWNEVLLGTPRRCRKHTKVESRVSPSLFCEQIAILVTYRPHRTIRVPALGSIADAGPLSLILERPSVTSLHSCGLYVLYSNIVGRAMRKKQIRIELVHSGRSSAPGNKRTASYIAVCMCKLWGNS